MSLLAQNDAEFVNLTADHKPELCCVDRRMDDIGVDETSHAAQITHAGGPLILHPDLQGEMPAHHVATLTRGLQHLAQTSPVARLDYHFGIEGGQGCGMFALLSGKNHTIREALQSPEDVREMLLHIRDKFAAVLATNCRITGTVVTPENDISTFDLDADADFAGLLDHKDLVL